MFLFSIASGIIIACLIFGNRVKNFLRLLKVPGPFFPNGIKGNLPEFMAKPRQIGPSFAFKYGPLYR